LGKIVKEVEIEAPVEEVFEFVTNPSNFVDMFPSDAGVSIDVLTEGEIGLGTVYSFSGIVGGQRINSESKYVEFLKNKIVREEQVKGDMKKWEQTQVFESIDNGTRITSTLEYEFPYSVLGKIIDILRGEK
jgi:ligand-binding SRPBCC domain-containing protein